MGKYVLAYTGGSAPDSPEEGQKVMEAWIGWFGSLGDAVVDMGNAFGASASVGADKSVSEGGASKLTGYSIVKADSVEAAAELAKSCPLFDAGGAIEVYEALDM